MLIGHDATPTARHSYFYPDHQDNWYVTIHKSSKKIIPPTYIHSFLDSEIETIKIKQNSSLDAKVLNEKASDIVSFCLKHGYSHLVYHFDHLTAASQIFNPQPDRSEESTHRRSDRDLTPMRNFFNAFDLHNNTETKIMIYDDDF